jgi:hypothetical protein
MRVGQIELRGCQLPLKLMRMDRIRYPDRFIRPSYSIGFVSSVILPETTNSTGVIILAWKVGVSVCIVIGMNSISGDYKPVRSTSIPGHIAFRSPNGRCFHPCGGQNFPLERIKLMKR